MSQDLLEDAKRRMEATGQAYQAALNKKHHHQTLQIAEVNWLNARIDYLVAMCDLEIKKRKKLEEELDKALATLAIDAPVVPRAKTPPYGSPKEQAEALFREAGE